MELPKAQASADSPNQHKSHYLPLENLARLDTHPLRAKGEPRPNPTDYTISLRAKFGTDQLLHHPGPRRQSLRGFEDHYADIIDFIVRATHIVWEDKNVGYLYDIYSHRAVVVDDSGIVWGRDQVIDNTLQAINAFPDFRGLAQEIVWSGNDEVGFYTSHRAVIKGTHTGYSHYGPPTLRPVSYWLVANCVTLANEIFEEWVLYNTSAQLLQLGYDLHQKARELGSQRRPDSLRDQRFGEIERLLGQGKPAHLPPPPTAGSDVEDFLRRMYHYIWNWRLVGKVADAYAAHFSFYGPTDRRGYGVGDYQAFVLSLLTMFPDLMLTVDEIYWMGNDREGYTTSTRWSLVGTHTGPGVYGPPSNRRIYMWGITQHVIHNGMITEEWNMYNEFDVLMQIMRE